METFDTNVVLRILLEDDPQQTKAALHIHAAIGSSGVFLPGVVLAEVAWVLRTRYRLDRSSISDSIEHLLGLPNIFAENAPGVLRALQAYRVGPADFSDYLILEGARFQSALPLHTFDAKLANEADARLVTDGER